MSSPIPPSSVSNSQMDNSETPNTTPPALPSQSDVEMETNDQEITRPDTTYVETPPYHTNANNDSEIADVSMTDVADSGENNREGTAADADEEDAFDDAFDETLDEDEGNSLTLPLAKIKRIFKLDPDYISASQSAVYASGLATELFVQYLAEQASLLARMDKRKKVQYKDFSNAVAGHDSLTFLSDTVPKTQPIGELIQQNKVNMGAEQSFVEVDEEQEVVVRENIPKKKVLEKGQQTLGFESAPNPVKKAVIQDLVSEN